MTLITAINILIYNIFRVVAVIFLFILINACDREGKKQCAWTLEPEKRLLHKAKSGYIPFCARNRRTMKQDCRLQLTFLQAKKFIGRIFRYVDMKVKSPALPRIIEEISFCDRG